MAVVILVAAGGLYLAFNHYNGKIDRISGVFERFGGERPPATKNDAQTFLLVGSDSREGANAKGTQGKGSNFVTGQRADTIILVHLFGSSQKAQVISFPRDTYVQIPEYQNPRTGTTRPAHWRKLNSAFAEGGPGLLRRTLEHLTNIRINHYLQVDFTGFKGMVDKLGGVEVCLTQPARERLSRIDLPAGRQHINGTAALAFVRQRSGLPRGDIDRIARQQQFIGSLANKILSAGTLLNPVKLTGFLDIATSSLKADESLTGDDLKKLALRVRTFSSGGISFVTVPTAGQGRRGVAGAVVLLDDDKAQALFTSIRNDVAPGKRPKRGDKQPSTPILVAPANVRVSVFNASGVNGLGRKAAQDITAVGFQNIGIPQTRGPGGATQTVILHGPDKADSARTLQAAVPGSVLQLDPSLGRTLQLVVGTSYTGAQKVTVSSQPTGPTGTKPTTPVQTAQDNPCTR